MKTKFLGIVVVVFTIFIFGGNYFLTRSQKVGDCGEDPCQVTFCGKPSVDLDDPGGPKEPSCSLVFSNDFHVERDLPCGTCIDVRKTLVLLVCDRGLEIAFTGGRGPKAKPWVDFYFPQISGKVYSLKCGKDKKRIPVVQLKFVEDWWRGKLDSPLPNRAHSRGRSSVETGPRNEVITGTELSVVDGDVGTETDSSGQRRMLVASGSAQVRSFCTGDAVSLAGPSALTLPNCDVRNVNGHWQGSYAQRQKDGKVMTLPFSLDLRKESSGGFGGDLNISDGAFSITRAAYDRATQFRLEALRKDAGSPQQISLHGNLSKGWFVLDGSIRGFAERLYIADNAVPFAVANQPYDFTLTAISPDDKAITFRLATPAITQPEQINWNKDARDLVGRNGERFTYGCPVRPPTNPTVYGTDVYTVDSPICNAAVHSGLISPQAGGVVTIQIKPDAGSYTSSTRNGVSSKSYGAYKGSYVFVKDEPNRGERGRLPKGLSFDSQSGTFSGTPTELGSFDISVVADDGTGSVFEQPLTIIVKKLVVTNRLLPDAFVGQPYAATLKVAGGQPPYRFSGGMPKGLTLDPNTGEISGKPSSPGSDAGFEVTIRDSQNNSESQNVSLRVQRVTILNSHFLPDAKVGVPYRTEFQAAGNLTPINWLLGQQGAGSIGLALNAGTGDLSGTPTKAGNFLFKVRAQDGSSSSSRQFALTIKPR